MKVKDVITLIKNSFLKNLSFKTDDNIISYIYLGCVELNRRFNLNIRSEVVHVYPDLAIYELRDSDVDLIVSVYDKNNCKLIESDVINSKNDKFKLINYRSFIYNTDKEEDLICIYKYSPKMITDINDTIQIPDTMLSALLSYIAYLGYSTIGSDVNSQRESDRLYKIYEQACTNLELQGYRINIFNESLYGQVKGFV